jgi:hypothetical protein
VPEHIDRWKFDGPGFRGLEAMLGEIGNAISEAMGVVQGSGNGPHEWFMGSGVNSDFASAYVQVQSDAVQMASELQHLVRSDEYAENLSAHGLGDGDSQWEFKRLIVEREFNHLDEARSDRRVGWWRKLLSRLRRFLHVANIILESVVSALAPNPVASALSEIKGFVEHLVNARLSPRAL